MAAPTEWKPLIEPSSEIASCNDVMLPEKLLPLKRKRLDSNVSSGAKDGDGTAVAATTKKVKTHDPAVDAVNYHSNSSGEEVALQHDAVHVAVFSTNAQSAEEASTRSTQVTKTREIKARTTAGKRKRAVEGDDTESNDAPATKKTNPTEPKTPVTRKKRVVERRTSLPRKAKSELAAAKEPKKAKLTQAVANKVKQIHEYLQTIGKDATVLERNPSSLNVITVAEESLLAAIMAAQVRYEIGPQESATIADVEGAVVDRFSRTFGTRITGDFVTFDASASLEMVNKIHKKLTGHGLEKHNLLEVELELYTRHLLESLNLPLIQPQYIANNVRDGAIVLLEAIECVSPSDNPDDLESVVGDLLLGYDGREENILEDDVFDGSTSEIYSPSPAETRTGDAVERDENVNRDFAVEHKDILENTSSEIFEEQLSTPQQVSADAHVSQNSSSETDSSPLVHPNSSASMESQGPDVNGTIPESLFVGSYMSQDAALNQTEEEQLIITDSITASMLQGLAENRKRGGRVVADSFGEETEVDTAEDKSSAGYSTIVNSEHEVQLFGTARLDSEEARRAGVKVHGAVGHAEDSMQSEMGTGSQPPETRDDSVYGLSDSQVKEMGTYSSTTQHEGTEFEPSATDECVKDAEIVVSIEAKKSEEAHKPHNDL